MSDATSHQPTARFARRPDRGVLLGFSWPRLIALAPCPLFLLAGFQFGAPGLAAAAILSIPFVAAAFVRFGGQTAAEWVPVGSVYLLRKARGQTEYVARVDQPRPLGTLALPGDAASVRFYTDPGSGICMLHDPYRQTISSVLPVQHPAYVLLGPDSQASRVSAYGRLLAGLAPSGTCASLQIVEATIPDSGRGVHEWYAEHGVHDGGWADQQYAELVATTTAAATIHRTTLTLSVNLKSAARRGEVLRWRDGGRGAGAARGDRVAGVFAAGRRAELRRVDDRKRHRTLDPQGVRPRPGRRVPGGFAWREPGARRAAGGVGALDVDAPRLGILDRPVGQRVPTHRGPGDVLARARFLARCSQDALDLDPPA